MEGTYKVTIYDNITHNEDILISGLTRAQAQTWLKSSYINFIRVAAQYIVYSRLDEDYAVVRFDDGVVAFYDVQKERNVE